MTQNNYPEGLDELADRVLDRQDLTNPLYSLDSADTACFAHALLDAIAERGYVLVDVKKQEPVGWVDDSGLVFWKDGAPPDGSDLYTHPAIPGRVALPDGWKVIGEVIGCFDAAFAEGLQEALAETQDERLKDLVQRRLMYALYAAQEADMQV